ncbi:MAG: hypothetical protein SOZ48_04900 [Eubacterium sp.]|nr:hypothetical protein [Eubacterium sp.]
MAKKVIVVRVGSKTTHIVHMENAISNPAIYGCVRIPTPERAFEDGMIIDVVEIARRIKKACQDKNIRTKDVIFTIASSKVASRETTIPVVNKTKVSQLVMSQVGDLFPVDSDSYIFSYLLQGKPRQDEEATQIQDVRVFAIPSDMVDCYYTLANTAGLNVVALEADGNSIFEIMRRQVKDGVTMAIQLNRESTLVNIITQEKLLLQRSIPYGVNAFAEVMMQEAAFQINDIEAAYKMLASQRVLLPHLNEENPEGNFSLEKRGEVTDNGEYMISNIARVVEYYNSKFKDQPIQEIMCAGVGCSVAGIHELIENEVGIPVRKPEVLEGIRFNRKVSIDAALLQYINCFGAVFKPVRFIPREVARKEAKKGKLTGSVMIFVGLFLLSAVLAGLSIFQVLMASDERDLAKAKHDSLAPIQNEYTEQMQIMTDYDLYKAVEAAVDTNGNHFHALINKISSLCPRSFKIQSISADEQKVTISAVSVDRLSSLSKLQMQLNTIDEIKSVKINQISESKDVLTKKTQYVYTLEFTYANAVLTEEGVQ